MNQSTAVASEPMAMQPAIARQNGRGVWLYNSPPATVSQISSKEATEHAVHSTARNSTRSHISGKRGYESTRVAERLETKTHVGLGPGESIEHIKHRMSLEGHLWAECCPESDTWHPYSYGQTKQRGA